MPNPPIPPDHFAQHELMLGLLYGLAMVLVLTKPNRSSSMVWSLLVTTGGYLALALLQLSSDAGSMVTGADRASGVWTSDWTLCHTWILAVLVFLTRAFENLRVRADHFVGRRRQFQIADLMAIATGFAILVAGVQHTSLIELGPAFWFGMLVITGVVPFAVVGLRIDRGSTPWMRCSLVVAGAGLLVVGLAWAESNIAQPGKIDFAEAATRYGWLIAAIMTPRLIEQSIAAARRGCEVLATRRVSEELHAASLTRRVTFLPLRGDSQPRRADVTRLLPSVVDHCSRPTLDADCLETQSDAHPDPFSMPRAVSRQTDTSATRQAQRGLNLVV